MIKNIRTVQVRPKLKYTPATCPPCFREHIELLEKAQEMDITIMPELKEMNYEERKEVP